jgi:ABC-2 type transport system permease protein
MKEILTDAWTVMQKEMREHLTTHARSAGGLIAGSVILLLGIILPLLAGPAWLERSWLLALWAWLPVFLVAAIVADSIAGERERHTLETLLASRLPDCAILLGKMAAAVVYGWGLMLITIIVSTVVTNLVYASTELLLHRPLLLMGGGVLSLLAAVLAASFGVLVSVRASSVRRAQQIITVTLLVLFLLHVVGMPLVQRLLALPGDGGLSILGIVFEHVEILGGLALALVALNGVLIAVAAAWFTRHRLRLD